MANAIKITASNGTTYDIKDTVSGYTNKTGNKTKVSTTNGLVGGDITTSGTIKCDLKSETKSSLATASRGSTSGREYAVGKDKNGDLAINVPWVDTTYSAGTHISISSNTVNLVNIGDTNQTDASNVTVSNNTVTQLASIRLNADRTYIILGVARWNGKTNYTNKGYRELWLTPSNIGTYQANERGFTRVSALYNNTGTDYIQHQVFDIYTTGSSSQTYYLFGRQTCGTSLTCAYPGIMVVRIA